MILLTVLGALGVLYIMILQLGADATFNAQYFHRVHFKEKSYYMARSAYSGLATLLSMEDSSFDSLQDQWAQEIPPYHFPDEQVYLRVEVEDMERYFNVNSIMGDGDQVNDRQEKQFRRLLNVLQINPDLSNAFLDWIDTDEERRVPGGADGLDYRDIPAKGGRLDSLEEILLIKGIEREDYLGRVSSGQAVPGLRDVLTVHSSGKVNVNTAGREILLSLDDEMTENIALEIIRRREETPFRSMDDLRELPGISHDMLYRLKQISDIKSEYFKIKITVESYQKDSESLTVIVKRSGQAGSIVFWKAD